MAEPPWAIRRHFRSPPLPSRECGFFRIPVEEEGHKCPQELGFTPDPARVPAMWLRGQNRRWLWAILGLSTLALGVSALGARFRTAGASGAANRVGAECEHCHQEIAREWANSEHANSADELFREAARAEPAPAFCESCHVVAREASQGEPRRQVSDSHGLDCVSCHGLLERGLFGHRMPKHSTPPPAARSGRECSGCHEFAFPGPRSKPEAMQSTLTEHAASSFAATTCVDCHMPLVGGRFSSHRSHAFREARDPTKLRQALTVAVERRGDTGATVTLRANRVGHAFPTGDLFRRLVVEVEAIGDDFAIVGSARRHLARHFTDTRHEGHLERRTATDDRVPADGERRLELELGPQARGHTLVWRVRYERVFHLNPNHEAYAKVASSVLLKSGTVPSKS